MALTSCGGGAAANDSKLAAAGVKAGKEFLDDLLRGTARSGEDTIPQTFQEAKASVGSGDAYKQTLDEIGESFTVVQKYTDAATGFDTSFIPTELPQLMAAAFVRNPTPEFKAHVDELAGKLLRNLGCTALRRYTDGATKAQEGAGVTYAYTDDGDTRAGFDFIAADLNAISDFSDWPTTLNAVQVAQNALASAKKWVGTVQAIYESPSGEIREANIVYLRACVVKPK